MRHQSSVKNTSYHDLKNNS